MSVTRYTSTKRPKLVKAVIYTVAAVCIVCIILAFIFPNSFLNRHISIFSCLLPCFVIVSSRKLSYLEIDDESGTITVNGRTQYPVDINGITYIKYKETKRKKRFYSLFIHGDGVKYLEFQTSRSTADAIVAHIQKTNPNVDIRHGGKW